VRGDGAKAWVYWKSAWSDYSRNEAQSRKAV